MWRIFNGIPRAIRAHFHGPRAATGANCVEEENFSENEIKQKVCNFQRTNCETETQASSRKTEQERQSWWQTQSTCNQWRQKNQEGFNWWASDRCGQEEEEGKDWKNWCRQHWHQADNDDKDWWKRQSCRNDFWSLLNGNQHAIEAVTWGAAVVLGLQLSRPRWRDRYLYDSTGNGHRRSSFLYQVTFALSGTRSTRRSIQPSSNSLRSSDATQTSSESSKLDKVMKEFQTSCDEYSALKTSITGLQQIEAGHMTAAVQSLKEASSLGHSSAQFNLGLCYEVGDGVEQDLDKAVEWYEKAGEAGHAEALYNLALLQDDEDKMVGLLEQAAELGLVQAQTFLGTYYSESEDPEEREKTIQYFKAAAEQNDDEAQCFLGMCYERGLGVEVNECKAAELYYKSAQSHNEAAMYNLAVFHEHGLGGLPQDKISAMELYHKAARAGNEHAQFRLDEIKARSAIKDWKVAHGDDNTKHPTTENGTNLSPSNSAPSISDYVRSHLSQLTLAISDSNLSMDTSDQDSKATVHQQRKKKPQFSLGENDLDDEDYLNERQSGLLTLSSLNPSSNCSVMGMGRNSTMPELGYIPCP